MTQAPTISEQSGKTSSTRHGGGALKVEQVPVADIRPNPKNARRHGPKQIAHLMATIERFGFVQPVLINQHNVLSAGHGRLEAAMRLGLFAIPAIRLSHLSEAELSALALADNRIAELATWDEEQLKVIFEDLIIEDLDFAISDVTGFDAPMIDAIVHGGDFAAPDPADAVFPAAHSGDAIARLGDVFVVGQHRISCGDARDGATLAQLMDGERAGQVIADGPFNVPIAGHVSGKGKAKHREFPMASGEMSRQDFIAFNCAWLTAARGVCRDGALIYGFMDGPHLGDLLQGGLEAGLELITLCVWAKSNAGMGSLYRSQIEHVAVFKSGRGKHVNNIELGRHGRNRSNLWTHPGMNAFGRDRDEALKLHPTLKPVGLLADIILDASRRGDIVLDPFLGAASTLIAAHRTGRRGFGVELDPLYVDASLDRLAAVLAIDPVRVADGAPWSMLRNERVRP